MRGLSTLTGEKNLSISLTACLVDGCQGNNVFPDFGAGGEL